MCTLPLFKTASNICQKSLSNTTLTHQIEHSCHTYASKSYRHPQGSDDVAWTPRSKWSDQPPKALQHIQKNCSPRKCKFHSPWMGSCAWNEMCEPPSTSRTTIPNEVTQTTILPQLIKWSLVCDKKGNSSVAPLAKKIDIQFHVLHIKNGFTSIPAIKILSKRFVISHKRSKFDLWF